MLRRTMGDQSRKDVRQQKGVGHSELGGLISVLEPGECGSWPSMEKRGNKPSELV